MIASLLSTALLGFFRPACNVQQHFSSELRYREQHITRTLHLWFSFDKQKKIQVMAKWTDGQFYPATVPENVLSDQDGELSSEHV